ncbi:hypothetical protein L3i20_v235680 [Paenibacillus sp. L3-i20]|nr:hypothetical protein L3i20_v235680 [Paenibacillus sp. L3-i20]
MVEFHRGSTTLQNTEPMTIRIDGYVAKKRNNTREFVGNVHLPDELLPIPKDRRTVDISFDQHDAGSLIYSYVEDGYTKTFMYGTMFANDDFSKIAIMNTSTQKQGDLVTPLMLSGPATNQEEALSISEELMKDYLNSFPPK